MIHELPLRPCIDYAEAIHYLEAVEDIFWRLLAQYSPREEGADLHTQTAAARRLLDLVLFGVLRQAL